MAKTKALISCEVTSQLICVFVFANAICWFSDAAAQLNFNLDSSDAASTSEYVGLIIIVFFFPTDTLGKCFILLDVGARWIPLNWSNDADLSQRPVKR